MNHTSIFLMLAAITVPAEVQQKPVDAPPAATNTLDVWPDSAPEDCPFLKSEQFAGLGFTGRHAEYTKADTWYPSWGADDRLYSPFTDGSVNGLGVGSGSGPKAHIGHAILEGNDPLALKVIEPATIYGGAVPYGGRNPCGSLQHNDYLVAHGSLEPDQKEHKANAPLIAEKPAPPFFAFCINTHDAKHRTFEQQVEMLKTLGYDGIGQVGLDQVAERLKTLDDANLKLFQLYVGVDMTPGAKQPYDRRLRDVLPLLKGRCTQLALSLPGAAASDPKLDARAVELIREISTLAEASGTMIVLYHHQGCWMETFDDALRVADKVDRPNVGVMFNLSHWLRVGKEREYRPLLKQAMPRLRAVSINGADTIDPQSGWGRYIQPLDAGTFDVRGLLTTLHELGYKGPVGLQCYGIGGDAQEHLARSLAAWRQFNEQER